VRDTPAWREIGSLFVQTGANSSELWLRQNRRDTLYRFAKTDRRLHPLPPERWRDEALTADCDLQQARGQLETDVEGRSVRSNGQVAHANGSTVLSLALSPSTSRLAVLSADGPSGLNLLPFLGRAKVEGTRWHQVYAWPSLDLLHGPVALPIGGANETVFPCWSPSENYVLYPNIVFYRLAIVAVDTT
jgi:hypothetical protein